MYLIGYLCEIFKQGFLPIRLSLPTLTELIFMSCRYLIPIDWKQVSIRVRVRFFQNLLITNDAWVFWKVYFWAGSLLIYHDGLELGKAVDAKLESVPYFNFWASCLYTFNPLSLSLKLVSTLVLTTYRNIESRKSCKNTYVIRIKGSERRPLF